MAVLKVRINKFSHLYFTCKLIQTYLRKKCFKSGTHDTVEPCLTVTSLLRPFFLSRRDAHTCSMTRKSLLMRPPQYYCKQLHAGIQICLILYNFTPLMRPLKPVMSTFPLSMLYAAIQVSIF